MTMKLTVADLKNDLNSQYRNVVANYLGGDEKQSLKFMSAIVNSVQQNPKLLDCERNSLYNAFMKCAEFNLYPSSVSGEAYVIPYSVKGIPTAQFQLGYKGVVTMLYRAGTKAIYSDLVRANDKFRVISGMNPTIEHEYSLGDRGEPIGVYVWAELNGQKVFKYMSRTEVETFKKFSQSASSKNEWAQKESPWNIDKDPELNMWRKTCLKQLAKLLPMNEDIYKAIDEDNKEADIKDYQLRSMKESAKSEGTSLASVLWQEEEPEADVQEADTEESTTTVTA